VSLPSDLRFFPPEEDEEDEENLSSFFSFSVSLSFEGSSGLRL